MAAAAAASAMPAGATTGPQTVSPDRNAAGKALVLVPLTLTKIDDLDFGTIIPSATSGFVTINAVPYGSVSIDGVEIGDTPIVRRALPPGAHMIRIVRPGFRPDTVPVTITVGNEVRVSRSLLKEGS